jgi:hypothetical protein
MPPRIVLSGYAHGQSPRLPGGDVYSPQRRATHRVSRLHT